MQVAGAPESQEASATRTSLIDSHVHIWDPGVLDYSWLEGDLDRAYLPAEYHAGSPSTTGVIFVEAGADDGISESHWVQSLDWPQLLGIVANAPLERGSAVAADIADLRSLGKTVGIRRLLQDEPLSFFEDPGLLEGLRALAAAGLPFDACIRHHQLPALTTLLGKVPELRVVLDHLAKPPVADGDDGTWERHLRLLAGLPQVSVKLSGLPPEMADDQSLPSVQPWLEIALDAFGAERAMVASDWPVSAATTRKVSPGEWISLVLDELGASDPERESLSWRTTAGFYGV